MNSGYISVALTEGEFYRICIALEKARAETLLQGLFDRAAEDRELIDRLLAHPDVKKVQS